MRKMNLIVALSLLIISSCALVDDPYNNKEINTNNSDELETISNIDNDSELSFDQSNGVTLRSGEVVYGFDLSQNHYKSGLNLPFSKNWVIQFKGAFNVNGRDFISSSSKRYQGLELFWWTGGGVFQRLSRADIKFVKTYVGDGSHIGNWPEAHYAISRSIKGTLGSGTHYFTLKYSYTEKIYRIFVDGILVSKFGFKILHMPNPITSIYSWGFSGRVSYYFY